MPDSEETTDYEQIPLAYVSMSPEKEEWKSSVSSMVVNVEDLMMPMDTKNMEQRIIAETWRVEIGPMTSILFFGEKVSST